ncbi:hypothetical protein PINS_up008817 [Pythium insidiosum]|nr:hypothetical protein PINS_up008817 [Pythium insidiosum]
MTTTYPSAGSCAELLLAEKKDAVYESEVKNLLRDLLERCVGPHVLSQLLPELSAASTLLYLLVTLGRKQPQQTLGEEFCDVLRVTHDGGNARAVGRSRHLLWVALAVLPTYLSARSRMGWHRLSQLTTSPRERMAQQLRERQQASANATNAATTARPATRSPLQLLDRLVAVVREALETLQQRIVPSSYEFALSPLLSWIAQLHLARFYVSTRFLDITKRLASIEYVFVRSDVQPALNLSLLVRCSLRPNHGGKTVDVPYSRRDTSCRCGFYQRRRWSSSDSPSSGVKKPSSDSASRFPRDPTASPRESRPLRRRLRSCRPPLAPRSASARCVSASACRPRRRRAATSSAGNASSAGAKRTRPSARCATRDAPAADQVHLQLQLKRS